VQAFAGPDFVTGYGLVDAQGAVNVIASGRFVEDFVSNECESRTWWVKVYGPSELKVTLAWDDPSGPPDIPYTAPRLVNDLDIELVRLGSATSAYPWLLDQLVVNSAGTPVPDAAQACGSALTVQRKVMPTPTPKFIAIGDPNNINDPISAVLQPAVKGKDHLNNAEQVVIAAPAAGWWQIRVTGFDFLAPPQRFSLVSSAPLRLFLPIIIVSRSCWALPACLPQFFDHRLCERAPKVCTPFAVNPGHFAVSFTKPQQALVVPVDRLCLFLVDCPACTIEARCRDLDLTFAHLPAGMRIDVYDNSGRRAFSDASPSRKKRVRVKTAPGRDYFVVLRPSAAITLHRPYDLQVMTTPPTGGLPGSRP
jgi:hypothetical protein